MASFYAPTTAGLRVNSFTDTYTAPATIGFYYFPNSFENTLIIGGTIDEVNAVSSGTDDYVLVIRNFATNPTFSYLSIASVTLPDMVSDDLTGTVSVTQLTAGTPATPGGTPATTAVTPEPSSFVLLGTGVLGAAAVARRRYC